ncbi:YtxH domain-containing protein [Paenibacillus qinlingensis]|uniref:Gas vesicle protein n=1 Tax=Paenibacillus qinlingensis TaxID=1837343 RepID=A0ABU1P3J6_9BACL|nr:YtxH domain-containing protein [Paenibacillus qinlingensis]MDR6554300.1 gas vesicle protein [Paenibacillus qinlingensis]
MSEAVETNKGGFFVGLLLGGAVGAVTSLLMAPKAGEKLRKDLWSTYQTWLDKSSQIASTLSNKTEEVVSKVSDKTDDIVSTVSDKTEDMVTKVTDKATHLVDTAKENKQLVSDSIQAAKTTFQNNQH